MNEYPYGSEMSQGTSGGMLGFVVGALVGASVALLLAPAPGGETRRRLGETAKRIGGAAKDKLNEVTEGMRSRNEDREGYTSGQSMSGRNPGVTQPGTPGPRT